MEISPIRPKPLPPSGRTQLSESRDTEALQRSREAERRVAEAQREAEVQLEHVRQANSQQLEDEASRGEHAIATEKNKGYETLKNLQRAQQAELAKAKREGEADLARVQTHYRTAVTTAEHQGRQELDQSRRTLAQQTEYEKKANQLNLEEIRKQNAAQFSQSKELGDQKAQELIESTRASHERLQQLSSEANERAEQSFVTRFQEKTAEQNSILEDIRERAGGRIKEIRQDTAAKLAAYSTRQKDPFYRMIDLGATLEDQGDHYVLKATIPGHEQKHVSVSIKGDHIVLSGYRRNEEKLELSPGRSKGTATYQSYHESFPLESPVEARQLSRAFDGDELVVKVPKKSYSTTYKPHQAKKIERARVESPQFPENLPVAKKEGRSSSEDEEPRTSRKTIGSRTLG
ncbi:MAG: Hsp20 family protein [Oligoflexia bacterium]|nr:Hsp20 family protein [Oligoflexia bacterium]